MKLITDCRGLSDKSVGMVDEGWKSSPCWWEKGDEYIRWKQHRSASGPRMGPRIIQILGEVRTSDGT